MVGTIVRTVTAATCPQRISSDAVSLARRFREAHLADHDLTVSQFGVLEALHHRGTLSQRDLARKLLTSTGNISIVLKNLESAA